MLEDKTNQYSLTEYDMRNHQSKIIGTFRATDIDNRYIIDVGFVRDIIPSNDN